MSALKQIALKPDFGIEDFLKEDAKVLYQNAFNTKHIGREIDFFLFEAKAIFLKSKDPEFFEYRFRHVLQLAIFNAWANYRKGDFHKCVEIEVGWDSEKMIVSVTGSVENDIKVVMPAGQTKPENENSNRIFRLLEQIQKFSDGLFVRHSIKSNRMQVISILETNINILDVFESKKEKNTDYVEVNEISQKKDASATSKVKPEPLSGSDLEKFKIDENKGIDINQFNKNNADIPNTDIPQAANEDWLTRVSKSNEAEAQDTTVSGSAIASIDEIRIKSTPTEEDESIKVISGGSTENKPDLMTFEAGVSDEEAVHLKFEADKIGVEDENIILQTSSVVSDDLKSKLIALNPSMSNQQYDEMFKQATDSIRQSMIKVMEGALQRQKLMHEGKLQLYKEQIATMSGRIEELKNVAKDAGIHIHDKYEDKPIETDLLMTVKESQNETIGLDLDEDNDEFETILGSKESVLPKMQMDEKSKEWVSKLIQDVKRERGELNQKIKEFEINDRKSRHVLKSSINQANDKLRMTEGALKQKDFVISKTKEALANTISTLDKYKEMISQNDKENLKVKLLSTEKLLSIATENSMSAAARVDELQQKWLNESTQRAELQREMSSKNKSIADLQRRVDVLSKDQSAGKADANSQRIIETLKTQMKQLTEKLQKAQADAQRASLQSATDARKASNSSNGDAELKHKYDQANKMIGSLKSDNDKLKKKYEDMKFSETKMKVEISRLQAQLKAATKK